MAITLSKSVQSKIKESIYRKADDFGYMYKSRIDNGRFMETLVKDHDIGEVLSQYMAKDAIKTYIKDAVLNRYMKDKKKSILTSQPEDLLPIIKLYYNQEAHVIESQKSVFLFRLESGDILLIAQGTLLKWETALRKALEFIEKAPGLPPEQGALNIVLNIASLGQPSTEADREHLRKALSHIGVTICFADLP